MKEALEDLEPFLRAGLEQAAELALGQHGDLGKLLPGDAQDRLNFPVDLFELSDPAAVREGQLRLGLLPDDFFPALGGALVLRVPAHGVLLPGVCKDQLHLRRSLRGGVFGAEHVRGPAVAAGLPEEGVGDGVKDRRLARAGVSGDEIEALGAQPVQGQDSLTGVGAEGRQGQAKGSHGVPSFSRNSPGSSQISSIRLRTKAVCSSVMG